MRAREYYTDENSVLWIKCSKCGEFKTTGGFNKSKNNFLWLQPKCKECQKQYNKWHYNKNKEHYVELSKERKRKNHSKVLERERNRAKKNPEKIKERRERWKDKRNTTYWFNTTKINRKANHLIQKNNLRPEVCSLCWWKWSVEFHHPSYENEDMWNVWVFCCKQCHEKIHSWEIECPGSINLLDLI